MRSFRIGSLFGIPIKLDLTFLLVLPLFAYLIGDRVAAVADLMNQVFGAGLPIDPLTTGATPWVIGSAAAIGLFAGVVLHELGHSLVAMRYGYPIDSITLWIFGGIASLSEMPEDWKQELQIAIAGPIVSVLVGVASAIAFVVVPAGYPAPRFVVGYLALMNLSLAVFNMLPGFPMDGGRVLRALLARRRPYARATQIAAEVGKLFALLLGLFGLFTFQILLIGIAFFVYIGASSEAQQVVMKAAFQNVTVRDIMTPWERLNTIERDESVATLIQRMFQERHTGYPVLENGALVGLVTLEDARSVPSVERDAYLVEEIMTTDLVTIGPDADAMEALQTMQEEGVGRLLVTDHHNELVGLISRTDLMTAFNIIQESGSANPASRAGTAD
ncbi:CBS domain-containing protein [Haloarchaeobius amylolyticus]|uniref:CBS domain-containing protein n=1 Tax=Haloarchaeobius amylolyticus TaxID=1198296 RepID=UPI0022722D88|nr:CBS domain-containing protein [Haloarchaeobius amylolyticus]